jgi:purine-binding chemotaxis protein CheW
MKNDTVEQVQWLRLVSFNLGVKTYAVDIRSIVEIIYHRAITGVPEGPEFIEGIIDLRGAIIPVVDLRKRFHADASPKPEHILIVRVSSKKVGLIVDRVSDVFSVRKGEIHSAEEILDHKTIAVKGVCKLMDQLILVVDLACLWVPEELSRMP